MAKFEKGKSGNVNGRPKGKSNKATTEFKEAVVNLLEYSSPKFVEWLDKIAVDNPEKALDTICKLAEFVQPKLSRVDQQTLDKDGNPADNKVIVEIVRSKGDE